MSEIAVSNSTCLIALERIGRLDLVSHLFRRILIPPVVSTECGHIYDWLEIKEPQNRSLVSVLQTQVDNGEAAALALALEVPDAEVVLDDKKARNLARRLGLQVVGTIGLLVRAKKIGRLDQITPLIDALDRAGFRLSESVRDDALRLAREM